VSVVAVDQGHGPVVVLVHGLGANHEDWRFIVPRLADTCRVIAVDLPGFGGTPALAPPVTVAGFAEALWGALDGHGVDAVAAWVGHSMGGAVAIEAALAQPARSQRLAVINSMPAFVPRNWRDHFEVAYRQVMARLLGPERLARVSALRMFPDDADQALRDAVIARGRLNRVAPYLDALRALTGWDARARLAAEWRKPLLWLAAELDYFEFAPLPALRQQLPQMRLRCYPGARHALPMSHPDAVSDELRALLQR
jgi:3-oxoadipate enol-lactonase